MLMYIEMKDSSKFYEVGERKIVANDKINFGIEKGELVIIVGASGAGKSTVLNILGGMDKNSEGSVYIDGKDISKLNDKELTKYRREDVGFVFQFYNLIPNLTALENVEMAAELVENALDPIKVLDMVGLDDRKDNFPSQLSGGEQQRVAIARALVKNPKLLLCDEPTGALDYKTGKDVLRLLQDTSKKTGTTVLIITHNGAIKPIGNRVIELADAKVRSIATNDSPLSIDRIEW